MKKLTLFLIIICPTGFAQSNIEGFIIDKETNEPLPYATIRISINRVFYTISNEDGKFKADTKFVQDSLEVSYIGFEPKKVAISYFTDNPKLYLDPYVSTLDEVVLLGKKDTDFAYALLDKLIGKHRQKKKITPSRAFLSLTSSARNIPIEQIEGFYNSEQNSSEGILDLEVKSGRFGQNKSFAFYSLDNTEILRDFQLFGTSGQILPEYPGNMTPGEIKRNYTIK